MLSIFVNGGLCCVVRGRRKSIITITQNNMKTDKNLNWGGQPYEAPSVTSLDILSEGLLCQSGMYDRADNGYDDDFDLGEI